MAEVIELVLTPASEDKLWAHGVQLRSALQVLDAAYKTFPDPRHTGRRFMIGPDAQGQLLTLVIEPADDEARACSLLAGRRPPLSNVFIIDPEEPALQDDPQPLTDDELAAIEPDDVEIRLAKSQVFSVRLSATELRLIAEEAGKVGLTTGAFIKQAALDAAETERYSAPPEMSVAITGTGFAILSNPGVESHPTVDAPGDRVVSPSPATEVA